MGSFVAIYIHNVDVLMHMCSHDTADALQSTSFYSCCDISCFFVLCQTSADAAAEGEVWDPRHGERSGV
eukprot:31550-Eustigmatos_ZCMA.PRE.1